MENLSVDGIRVVVNPLGGMLDHVVIADRGRSIEPLHRAPWIGEPPESFPPDMPPHLGVMAGDFFCAPFGRSDIEPAPLHGWPANGTWTPLGTETAPDGALTARFELEKRVAGASLEKRITLRPGHPVIYQTHVFTGGEGAVPVAHHAMIEVPGGARLSFSRKDFGATQDRVPIQDGGSRFAYPQRFENLARVRDAKGGTIDARTYPFDTRHVDLACLVDPVDADFGWTAALAREQGFLFFAVKDPRVLGQTMLWMSHGAVAAPPWRSRHLAVLGLEEASNFFVYGHRASTAPNWLSDEGYRTALPLVPDGTTEVRYALGAIVPDPDWTEIIDIAPGDGKLVITDIGGGKRAIPFDTGFLTR